MHRQRELDKWMEGAWVSTNLFRCCEGSCSQKPLQNDTIAPNLSPRVLTGQHTCWPWFLGTKADSPVSIDSSTEHLPSTISPSTGMRSPGSTLTMSPGLTPAVGTIAVSTSEALLGLRGSCRLPGFSISLDCAGMSLARVCRSAATNNKTGSRTALHPDRCVALEGPNSFRWGVL